MKKNDALATKLETLKKTREDIDARLDRLWKEEGDLWGAVTKARALLDFLTTRAAEVLAERQVEVQELEKVDGLIEALKMAQYER